MPDDSMRTVLVALGSGFAVALAKAVVAVVTGSAARTKPGERLTRRCGLSSPRTRCPYRET